jgi:hypothetical protein
VLAQFPSDATPFRASIGPHAAEHIIGAYGFLSAPFRIELSGADTPMARLRAVDGLLGWSEFVNRIDGGRAASRDA